MQTRRALIATAVATVPAALAASAACLREVALRFEVLD